MPGRSAVAWDFVAGETKVVSQARPTSWSLGVTLVELLVVLTLIGLLVSLTLHAITGARDRARALQCQAKLRQLGLAMEGFVAARGSYPPAARLRIGQPGPGESVLPRAGLFVFLLPYLDQRSLGDRYDFRHDWNDPVNLPVTGIDWSAVICPAAPVRRGKQATDYTTIDRVDPTQGNGLGDLIASGRIPAPAGAVAPDWGAGGQRWRGLLQVEWVDHVRRRRYRPVRRPRDVRDGLSRTWALVENAGKPICYEHHRRAKCHITRFRWASATTWMTLNDFCLVDRLLNCKNNSQPYAFHHGGIYTLRADGGVMFVTEQVAAELFVAFVTAAGRDGPRS